MRCRLDFAAQLRCHYCIEGIDGAKSQTAASPCHYPHFVEKCRFVAEFAIMSGSRQRHPRLQPASVTMAQSDSGQPLLRQQRVLRQMA